MTLLSVAFGFLSSAWTILSVTPAILSVALISFRHFGFPIRRLNDFFRRSDNPIPRSESFPSL
ncbi:hypothetical protein LSPCS325_27970 [Lysinibacillus sp. CTST325]